MPTAPKQEKKDYKIIPKGTKKARCISVVIVGLQDFEWKGEKKSATKVRLTWELPTEVIEYEKDGVKKTAPMVISNEYTFSMGSKANLRKVVEDMLGTSMTDAEAERFDIYDLVGTPCLLSVVHNTVGDKTYANIGSLAQLMEGMEVPPQVNPSVKFDVANWDQAVFDTLPKFVQERIMQSHEKRTIERPAASTTKQGPDKIEYPTEDINPEDIPF